MGIKVIYVVFETDTWNRNPNLVGVFETKEKAIDAILEHCDTEDRNGEEVTPEEVAYQLRNYLLTLGFDTNYDIKVVYLNEWI